MELIDREICGEPGGKRNNLPVLEFIFLLDTNFRKTRYLLYFQLYLFSTKLFNFFFFLT